MARTRVVIAEDNFDGHRWMYVRLLLTWLREHGIDACLATVAEVGARELDEAARLGATVEVLEALDLDKLAAMADRVEADLVVVPDGDQLALQLGRGARWTGDATLRVLVMRATAQPTGSAAVDAVRNSARRLLLGAACHHKNVDIVVLASGAKTFPSPNEALDPVEFRPQDRRMSELDVETTWLGVIGAIDPRKNVDLVVEAAALATLRSGRRFGVLVAGRVDSAVTPLLQRMQNAQVVPLLVVDRRLDDDELDGMIRDVDVAVMAHSNDGPSGILAKALSAGTKVLAAGSPVLRRDVDATSKGACWTSLDVNSLADGLLKLAMEPDPEPLALGSEAFCRRLLG